MTRTISGTNAPFDPRTKFDDIGEKRKGGCCPEDCVEDHQEKHEANVSGKGWPVDAH